MSKGGAALLHMGTQLVRLRHGEAIPIDFRVDQNQRMRQRLIEAPREKEGEAHLAQSMDQTQRADFQLRHEHAISSGEDSVN